METILDWRQIPFVRLLIFLTLGILAAEFLPSIDPLSIWGLLAVAVVACIILVFAKIKFRWQWVFGVPLSISLFLFGYALTFFQDERHSDDHFAKNWTETPTKNDHFVLAKVTDATERGKNFRLTLSIEKIGETADSMQETSGNLLVYLRKDTLKTPPQYLPAYGDVILLTANVQAIEPPKNPNAFDFQRYWHRQNIHFQCFVNTDDVVLLAQQRGNPVIQFAQNAQMQLLQILKKHLPTEREFAVGSALLLGYRDAVTPEVRDAYVETGSMHLLAVSGMHVMILFQMLEWGLNIYKSGNRRWRWAKAILAIVVVCLFSLLTGLTASVLRAAVMSIFFAIGKALQTRVNVYNILASAAFALLLWNPMWLFDVGFQLSFLAVAGIVFFQPLLFKLWIFRIDDTSKIGKKANWAVRWMGESLMTGVAAQLVVTPISLFYFHQFPTYFWLSSVVGVAISNLALVGGIVLFLTDWVGVLGVFVGKILFGLLWSLNEFIFLLQKFPFSVFDSIWWSTGFTILVYTIIFGIAATLSARRLRAFFTPLSMIAVLSIVYAFSTISQVHQRRIVVYHVYKNTVVDVVEGERCWSFSDVDNYDSEAQKRLNFAVYKHRIQLKIKNLQSFPLDTNLTVENLFWQNGCLQFYNLKILFLNRPPPSDLQVEVDAVVIHNNPKLNVETLEKNIKFKEIIFDASNTKRKVEMWTNMCKTLGYPHFDINRQGAWIREL
jgi:competence protein ComEC